MRGFTTWVRGWVDEATREKAGPCVGHRSSTRVGFFLGLGLLLLLFAELTLVFVLLLLEETEWARFSGYFTVATAFIGSTVAPFIVRNWRRDDG